MELELFKKRIESLFIKAYDGNLALINFIDDTKREIILKLAKNYPGVDCYFNGGIKDSDYNRCILSINEVEDKDFKIDIYKIDYNKRYYEVSHRSILGSLMALGIKRECIGDIVIIEAFNGRLVDLLARYEYRNCGRTTNRDGGKNATDGVFDRYRLAI